MELNESYASGVCEQLKDQFEKKVIPVFGRYQQQRDRLSNLKQKVQEYESRIAEELPLQRQKLESELGRLVANGDDESAVLHKMRELDAEISQLENLLETLKKNSISREKYQLDSITEELRKSVGAVINDVRSESIPAISEGFQVFFDIQEMWNQAVEDVLDKIHDRELKRLHYPSFIIPFDLKNTVDSFK